jgi:hypothetical protein
MQWVCFKSAVCECMYVDVNVCGSCHVCVMRAVDMNVCGVGVGTDMLSLIRVCVCVCACACAGGQRKVNNKLKDDYVTVTDMLRKVDLHLTSISRNS